MCALIYRIPETQLFLSEDGSVMPHHDSDEVREASQAPEDLGTLYVGNCIRQLAQFRDANAPWYEHPGYKTLKEASELVTLGVSFIDFAESLSQWISGAPGHPDPIMQHLAQLHIAMSKIQDFQLASWVSSREDNLAFLRAHSSTAIQTAAAFAREVADSKSSPSVTLNQPYWAAKMALADNNSAIAVNTFTGALDSGYWMRPHSIPAMSTDGDPMDHKRGWMQHIPDRAPVNGFGQVWDYRWALPSLVYAIGARIVFLRAVNGLQLYAFPEVVSELHTYIKFLDLGVWGRMNAGVRSMKWDTYSAEDRHNFLQSGDTPAFAADIYGGRFAGGTVLLGYYDMQSSWGWWTGPKPGPDWKLGYGIGEAGAKKFVDNIADRWAWG